MIEYYVTLEANEEQKQEFQTDIARNGILILRVEKEEESDFYHYSLQGDWNGYQHLMKMMKESNTYKIHSLEHFEE